MDNRITHIRKLVISDSIKKTAGKLRKLVVVKSNIDYPKKTISYIGFDIESIEMDDSLISYIDFNKQMIFINKSLNEKESNFALGKIIGNILYNRNDLVYKLNKNINDYTSEQFAYDYLLPELPFIKNYILCKNKKHLSNKYRVPEEQIKTRIRQLGLK